MRRHFFRAIIGGAAVLLIMGGGYAGTPEPPRCTVMLSAPWFRPDSVPAFVATGTGDSILVGRYVFEHEALQQAVPSPAGLSRVPAGHARGSDVYGQIVELEGDTPYDVRSIILVWWSYDTMCMRDHPAAALGIRPMEEVFIALAPRPKGEWIDDIPTFDVDGWERKGHRAYTKSAGDRFMSLFGNRVAAMTPRQLAAFYNSLPTSSEHYADNDATSRRIARWGSRNPELGRMYPASEIVETATARCAAQVPPAACSDPQ